MCTDLMIYSAEKLRACKNSKPLLRVTTTLKAQQCSLISPRTNQNFAIKKDSLASSDLDTDWLTEFRFRGLHQTT
jgi:hypothetical protein